MPSVPPPTYDRFSRWLHAALALLILAEFGVALAMPDIHRGTPDSGLVGVHLALGAAILPLALLRLLWALLRRAPAALPGPLWQTRAARLTHLALLLGFVLLPLLGWVNASARGYTVQLAGLLPLPALAAPGAAWSHGSGGLHQLLAWGLLALIGLHVVAALYHQLLLRDGILARISPRR